MSGPKRGRSNVSLLAVLVPLLGCLPADAFGAGPGRCRRGARSKARWRRGLALVQKAAANYPNHRTCFSCHHQTLPMLAVVAARGWGVAVDAGVARGAGRVHPRLVRGAHRAHARGEGDRRLGHDGRLRPLGARPRGPHARRRDRGHGRVPAQDAGGRRPLVDPGRPAAARRVARDRHRARGGRPAQVRGAVAARGGRGGGRQGPGVADGGPSEGAGGPQPPALGAARARRRRPTRSRRPARPSWPRSTTTAAGPRATTCPRDAYATGQTLARLLACGLAADHPAVARGVRFLLESQLADGSWKVETRAEPGPDVLRQRRPARQAPVHLDPRHRLGRRRTRPDTARRARRRAVRPGDPRGHDRRRDGQPLVVRRRGDPRRPHRRRRQAPGRGRGPAHDRRAAVWSSPPASSTCTRIPT